VIARRDLVRALLRRSVADWIVLERAQELGVVDDPHDLRRREKRTRTTVIIHHDVPRGRGSARLDLTSSTEGDALAVVDEAISLATTTVGPAWKTVPPAAPAQVRVLDPALAELDLIEAATTIARGVRSRAARVTTSAIATVLRERTTVQAKSGFHDEWLASYLRVEALVVAADRSLEIVRDARRLGDLGLQAAVSAAISDLEQLASAGPPIAGRADLIMSADALLHGHGLGVWSVFAAQADSIVERQGLTRYRLGTPIAPGANQVDEPLTITSDGALDFATGSSPVGDDGDAVRRFALIERGVSVGLGLSTREAALRRRDPNGGVRNLVVAPGTWRGKPGTGRTIEIRRLRALSIDAVTGDASLELGLAFEHRDGRSLPFTGGTIRLDLVAALARARRSATTIQRGAYLGPASVLIDGVDLIV
jgi:predicted Zn-dependent protease